MTYAASFSESDNVGSLSEVYLAPAHWLSGVNPMAFKSGKDWEAIDFVPETAGIKDTSTPTPNGTEYSYQVVFIINKQNAALYATMQKYLQSRGVLYCIDQNGLGRIIGTPDYPVTFTHEADTGTAYPGLNYFKVMASWVSSEMAVVL